MGTTKLYDSSCNPKSETRIPLKPNNKLSFTEDNINYSFKITKLLGSGGSAIAYRAKKGRISGVIKEFYPSDNKFHKRNDKTNIVKTKKKDCNEYLKSYRKVLKLLNGKNEVTDYIPKFEIFSNGLIWFPADTKTTTIKALVNGKTGAERCKIIIDALCNLSKAISFLHENGFCHMDITPENFGFKKSGSLSLFDVNTITEVGKPCHSCGTEFFRHISLVNASISGNQATSEKVSDVFSIGATAFFLLTEKLYDFSETRQSPDYKFIRNSVNACLLWLEDGSEKEALSSALSDTLFYALKNDKNHTVAELTERFQNCSKVFDTLSFNGMINGSFIFSSSVVELDKNYNENIETGADGAITWELYNRPLFENAFFSAKNRTDNVFKILVVGNTVYSQKFIDLAFMLMQKKHNIHTHIIVLTDDINEAENSYIKSRPYFKTFFSVNAKTEKKSLTFNAENRYGQLDFFCIDLSKDMAMRDFLNTQFDANYIFIATSDTDFNKSIYKKTRKTSPKTKLSCDVRYLRFTPTLDENDVNSVNPFNVLVNQKQFDHLKNIAYREHLVWNDFNVCDETIISDEVKQTFNRTYNFESSLKSAIGFEYSRADTDDIKLLAYLEHRRWVTNQLCDGWLLLKEDKYTSLLPGERSKCIDKNTNEKFHACLVLSSKETPLENFTSNDWECCDEIAFSSLDPLDKVSVQLHRAHKLLATKKKNTYSNAVLALHALAPEKANELNDLSELISSLFESNKSFDDYRYLIRQCKNVLTKLKNNDSEIYSIVFNRLSNDLLYLFQWRKFEDFKNIDLSFFKKLDFILNGKHGI